MRPLALATVIVLLALAGCSEAVDAPVATPRGSSPDPVLGPPIRLEPFLAGLQMPLLVTHDGDEGELFVVEQGGIISRVVKGEREEWLDVRESTAASGERGLLGLAFEPDADRAYVSYTDTRGDSILERVRADGSREEILKVDQPYSNHNGGHLAFGPDGMLYYGLGDGGSGGDPQGNGQDKDALLASLLRLDVSGESGYRVPEDNPYGTLVWAKGLRNPWRFTFDRATGDLYIGDVGQNRIEEIDFVPAGEGRGANFGWNVYEGSSRYGLPVGNTFSEHWPPVAEYTHDDGCSVTGGYVYRGDAYPTLDGAYFFGDYCSGRIWAMQQVGAEWRVAQLLDTDASISSFGEDADGELYVVDHGGEVLRLIGTGAPLPFGRLTAPASS